MSILTKEPEIARQNPNALSDIGARKVILFDPLGKPSASGHDEWRLKFLAASISSLPGWEATVHLGEIPPAPSNDPSSILLLVDRSDGRTWGATTAKKAEFTEKIQAIAGWINSGRLVIYGTVPNPARLLRGEHVGWDVAIKEQWATWFDSVWPNLYSVGCISKGRRLFIGDENCWAFATPLDHVIAVRGLSPVGLSSKIRSAISEQQFSQVCICTGLAYVESAEIADDYEAKNDYFATVWQALVQAFQDIAVVLNELGYWRYVERPDQDQLELDLVQDGTAKHWGANFYAPPLPLEEGKGASFQTRSYLYSLVKQAAANSLPVVELEPGAWQDSEKPGMTSPHHAARTGSGVAPKSRSWSPARSKK